MLTKLYCAQRLKVFLLLVVLISCTTGIDKGQIILEPHRDTSDLQLPNDPQNTPTPTLNLTSTVLPSTNGNVSPQIDVETINDVTPDAEIDILDSINASLESKAFSCLSEPVIFNARDTFGIQIMTSMTFLSDDKIEVGGWGNRLDKQNLTSNGSGNSLLPSDTYKLGHFNLGSGESLLLESEFTELLQNPCQDEFCIFEIVEQSPDGNWQLIRANKVVDGSGGIWLISKDDKVQLTDFPPARTVWSWSKDSEFLLFQHSQPEFGMGTLLIWLGDNPIITKIAVSDSDPLESTFYHLAYSPESHMILSTAREYSADNAEKLYTIEILDNVTEVKNIEAIPNLVKVEWDEGIYDFLLISSYDEYIEIKTLGEGISFKIFLNTFNELIPRDVIKANIPFDLHRVSIESREVSVTLGDGRLFIFSCNT